MERDLGGIALALLVLGAGCGAPAAPAASLAPTVARCPEGFEEGPQNTCFALPAQPDAHTATVLYVHSASNERTVAHELEVVRQALGSSMGVLFVRGSESECAFGSDVKATYCWPGAADAENSQRTWERWDKVQWQAEALLPEGTHPRLVVGFKEGAAFAARAFRLGGIHATTAALIAPPEGALEGGPYPRGLVGIGAPASAASVFAHGTELGATCPRATEQALTEADVGLAQSLLRWTQSGDKAAHPDLAACTLHVSASTAQAH